MAGNVLTKASALIKYSKHNNLVTSAVMLSNFKFSKELTNNDFWNKKFRHAVSVRDVDKDGFITRSDFQIVVQRYRDMG